MENGIDISKYKKIFENIRQEILKSQYKAMQVVNKELIFMYWHIGKIRIHQADRRFFVLQRLHPMYLRKTEGIHLPYVPAYMKLLSDIGWTFV